MKELPSGGCQLLEPTGSALEAGLLAGDMVVGVGKVDTRKADTTEMNKVVSKVGRPLEVN